MPQIITAGGVDKPFRAVNVGQFFDYLRSRVADTEVTTPAQAYANVAWVYRCATLRVQTIGGMPWRIMDAEGNEVEWPLADVLPAVLGRIELALCSYGASYVLKQTNRFGIKDLQWLNPLTMRVLTDKAGVVGFQQTVGTVPVAFGTEEIIYHRLYNLADDLGPGVSPMQVAMAAAGMASNANQYVAKFFATGAIPAVVLTTDQVVSEAEVKRVGDVWQRLFGGIRNAWKTAVLQQGLTPTVIGSKLDDLTVEPILQDARMQIAVAFGIPQTLIEDAANFATAREHKLSFYYETIFPECRMIEAGLNEQLFSPLGLHFEFAYSDVEAVQQDEATKVDALSKLFSLGVISRDELREQLGYEVAPAEAQIAAVAEAASGIEQAAEQLQQDAQETIQRGLRPEVRNELARWRRKAKRGASGFESDVIPEWLKSAIVFRLGEQRDAADVFAPCLRAFDRGGAEDKLTRRLKATLGEHAPGLIDRAAGGKMPDTDDLRDALLSVLVSGLATIVADALLAEASDLGLEIDYAEAVTDAGKWAAKYCYELVKGIDSTTRDALQNVVSQVVDGKLAKEDAATMLEPLFGETRARAIAATETTRATTRATAMYRDELNKRGIKTNERWLTAEDEMVCPECEPLDHQLEDVWREAAPDGPPLHVNCRCATVIEAVS